MHQILGPVIAEIVDAVRPIFSVCLWRPVQRCEHAGDDVVDEGEVAAQSGRGLNRRIGRPDRIASVNSQADMSGRPQGP